MKVRCLVCVAALLVGLRAGAWEPATSKNRDNRHFITHAGTAFALMALAACGEVKS